MVKKLPELGVIFPDLYSMLLEPIRSKTLIVGAQLKVFDQLSEPKSASAVAKAVETHPGNTRFLLDTLVAMGFLHKKDGLYRNRPVAQTFLVEESSTSVSQFLVYFSQRCESVINNMLNLIKEGPSSLSCTTEDQEQVWAESATMSASFWLAGAVQQIADLVSKLPEFPSFRKMLDLGGGTGLKAIAIVAAHPTMKGVVFDQPQVVKVAESFIKEYEAEDRIEVVGGDYTKDPVGEGYDLVWTSYSLNFVKDNIDPVVRKVYDAMNSGGVFISFSEGMSHERTAPEAQVLNWLVAALMGRDAMIDEGVVANSMLRAGFKSVRSRTVDTSTGPMELDIGRK